MSTEEIVKTVNDVCNTATTNVTNVTTNDPTEEEYQEIVLTLLNLITGKIYKDFTDMGIIKWNEETKKYEKC